MDNLVFARGIVFLLFCVMYFVFYVYYKIITRYEDDSIKRGGLGGGCVVISLLLFVIQIKAYSGITKIVNPLKDDFFFFVFEIAQAAIPLIFLFVFLIKKRMGKKNSEKN